MEPAESKTVKESLNPRYYQLIKEFDKLTGVPIVLNTSLNKLEPIVCSPQDAVNTLKNASIYYLAIGNFLVDNNWFER